MGNWNELDPSTINTFISLFDTEILSIKRFFSTQSLQGSNAEVLQVWVAGLRENFKNILHQ